MGASIRIILDTLHATSDTIFISFEIDDSVVTFVSASFMPRRYAAVVDTAAGIGFRGK